MKYLFFVGTLGSKLSPQEGGTLSESLLFWLGIHCILLSLQIKALGGTRMGVILSMTP